MGAAFNPKHSTGWDTVIPNCSLAQCIVRPTHSGRLSMLCWTVSSTWHCQVLSFVMSLCWFLLPDLQLPHELPVPYPWISSDVLSMQLFSNDCFHSHAKAHSWRSFTLYAYAASVHSWCGIYSSPISNCFSLRGLRLVCFGFTHLHTHCSSGYFWLP